MTLFWYKQEKIERENDDISLELRSEAIGQINARVIYLMKNDFFPLMRNFLNCLNIIKRMMSGEK